MFCDHVPSGLPPHGIRSVRGFRLGSFWATRPTTGRLAEERPRRRWKSQASYGLAAVGCRVWATWEGRMKATQRNCQASLAELRRDAPPFVTQLRRVPTESRDLHVFLEDAVADGEVVEVLEVQGEFARVLSPDRRCGWVQSRYLQFSAPASGSSASCRKPMRVDKLPEDFDVIEPLIITGGTPGVNGWKGQPLSRLQSFGTVVTAAAARARLAQAEEFGHSLDSRNLRSFRLSD
eukprot:s684_g4.t2